MNLDILYKIEMIGSPILSPAVPAFVLGSKNYAGMVAEGIPSNIAIGVSVLSGLGMEAAGALSLFVAIKAWQNKSYKMMAIGVICALCYAGFVIYGLETAQGGKSFVSAVLISLVSFAVSGATTTIFDAEQEARRRRADEKKAELERIEARQAEASIAMQNAQAEVMRLEAERKLANAQNRGLKLAGNPAGNMAENSEPNGNLPETFRDWRSVPAEHRQKMAGMSPAEISQTYRVSERTARNWANNAREPQP